MLQLCRDQLMATPPTVQWLWRICEADWLRRRCELLMLGACEAEEMKRFASVMEIHETYLRPQFRESGLCGTPLCSTPV